MEYCKAMKKGLEGHDMLSLKKKSPVSEQKQNGAYPCFSKNHTHIGKGLEVHTSNC